MWPMSGCTIEVVVQVARDIIQFITPKPPTSKPLMSKTPASFQDYLYRIFSREVGIFKTDDTLTKKGDFVFPKPSDPPRHS